MDLDITPEQIASYADGVSVQIAFPHLNDAEREFIHTGYTPEDWAKIFPPGYDDDEADAPDEPNAPPF